MSARVERISARFYQGLWGVLTRWFRLPQEPPRLPVLEGEVVDSFRPAEGFLRYLTFKFWIGLMVMDGLILIGWVICLMVQPWVGAILFVPALALAVLPDIVVYVAIHLRYDTTWYVMTDRSLRIRRGIWTIHETTITSENVQNVSVSQGPLQRYFGIADVLVDTAGGGGQAARQHDGTATLGAHQGLIEGIADAPRIRELLVSRMRRSRAAGLGDEDSPQHTVSAWTDEQICLLREIRDSSEWLVRAVPPQPAG